MPLPSTPLYELGGGSGLASLQFLQTRVSHTDPVLDRSVELSAAL